MPRLLVADCTDAFTDSLCEQLGDVFEIKRCDDGRDVIPALHTFQPDLLLLDLMIPGCDGLTILESVCAMEDRPVVLVVSRIFGFYVQDSLERLGVSYAMQKPCDAQAVSNRIRDLARYPKTQLLPQAEEDGTIHSMLRALGFSGKHMGYRCLVEAVRSIANEPGQLYTKELYPAVGKILGCNWRQVERDIRTAIDSAWETRDTTVWEAFFPRRLKPNNKPTNSELIATLGQLLRKNINAQQNHSNSIRNTENNLEKTEIF